MAKKQITNNVHVDIELLNEHGLAYIKKKHPNTIDELKEYCIKEEIDIHELEITDRVIFDFFDERKIISWAYYNMNKGAYYVKTNSDRSHNCSLNGLIRFKNRYAAEICAVLHSFKHREKELVNFLKAEERNESNR